MVNLSLMKEKLIKIRIFDICTLILMFLLLIIFFGITVQTTTYSYSSQTDLNNPTKSDTYTTAVLSSYLILCGILSLFLCYIAKEPHSLYPCFLYYMFCITSTILITMILKYLIARPRPDTITLCDSPSSDACKEILTKHYIFNQYQSFPSGHASFSMCVSTFLYCFLNEILPVDSFIYIMIKILPLFGAFFISFTRIWDFQYHTEDVVCGLLLGAVIGLLSFKMYKHEIHTKLNEQISPQNKAETESISVPLTHNGSS